MRTDYAIGIKRLTEVNCCPVCKCNAVKETRKWAQHCNGHWNESIEFDCGAKYEFSPNFMCVGLSTICKQNPEFKERVALTKKVREEIFELAEKRGIHADELTKLKSSLEYWYPSTW